MDEELGLNFVPLNRKFKEMMVGLQSIMQKKENKLFILNASADCEKRFSSSFTGPSNKLSGWAINKEEFDSFVKAHRINALGLFESH